MLAGLQHGEPLHEYQLAAYIPPCKHSSDVSQTHGESVERAWAALNPYARSTIEMGPGTRGNVLDDFEECNRKLKEKKEEAFRDILSLDANFRLKMHPRNPAHAALLKGREVRVQNAPGNRFPVCFSIDATFKVTKLGPDGCEGLVHDEILLDHDYEEIPPLLCVDDDEDTCLEVSADDFIVKSKL